jgi:mono/diheme cytochrome c family protein
MKLWPLMFGAVVIACIGVVGIGCRAGLPPGKPVDALTAEEAAGHAVYQKQCARCHAAYTTQGLHGPSLYGIFRKPYLPSGAPANDDRVTAVIEHGRGMMPSFASALPDTGEDAQLAELIKYLHTL